MVRPTCALFPHNNHLLWVGCEASQHHLYRHLFRLQLRVGTRKSAGASSDSTSARRIGMQVTHAVRSTYDCILLVFDCSAARRRVPDRIGPWFASPTVSTPPVVATKLTPTPPKKIRKRRPTVLAHNRVIEAGLAEANGGGHHLRPDSPERTLRLERYVSPIGVKLVSSDVHVTQKGK